jgi:hypothetical protein
MGKPRKKADWNSIRASYQKSEGSCRELAEKFGVNHHTVEARCKREGWRKEKSEIAQNVTEKVQSQLVDEATDWIIKMKVSCLKDLERIEATYAQLEPAADPVAIRCLTQAKKAINDIMRQSIGIQDAPKKLEHSGSLTVSAAEILDDDLRDE